MITNRLLPWQPNSFLILEISCSSKTYDTGDLSLTVKTLCCLLQLASPCAQWQNCYSLVRKQLMWILCSSTPQLLCYEDSCFLNCSPSLWCRVFYSEVPVRFVTDTERITIVSDTKEVCHLPTAWVVLGKLLRFPSAGFKNCKWKYQPWSWICKWETVSAANG